MNDSLKKSMVIPVPDDKFEGEKLFLNLKNSLKLVSSAGFRGVEFSLLNPQRINPERFEALLKENDLSLAAVGTGRVYLQKGLSLTSDNYAECVNYLKQHVDFAAFFNVPVIIGLVRGFFKSTPEEKAYENLTTSLRSLARYGMLKGNVQILIEPLNRYETDFLNSVEETVSFIQKLNYPNIGLLFDTFHANIEEKNFTEPILYSKMYLKHVHFADSNRLYPGAGHIDFDSIIATLKEIGYTGFISCEVLYKPSFEEAVKLCGNFKI